MAIVGVFAGAKLSADTETADDGSTVYKLRTSAASGGGGAATIADGADVAEGATTDAVVAAGAAGSVSAKLRRLTTDIDAFKTANHADLIAATPAGTNLIGKVGIDQTTPGTTNAVVATGSVANNVADSGNGVKGAGVYSTASTLTSLTAGVRADVQSDVYGNARVRLAEVGSTPADTGTSVGLMLSANTNQVSSTTALPLGVLPYVFNGTNSFYPRGDGGGAVNQPYALASSRVAYVAATGGISNTTTAVTMLSAAGAGVRNYIAAMQISWDTLGAATEVVVRDGAAGTVLHRVALPTTAGNMPLNFPMPLRGTANTLMEVATLTATVTGGVRVNAQGFTSST